MRNLFFAALGGLFLLQTAACQKEKGIKTPLGHRFINHTNLPGKKIESGEVANINLYVWVKDSLISSTIRDQGGPQDMMIPAKESLNKDLLAHNEALFMMTNGDSATVIQQMDSMLTSTIKKRFGIEAKEMRFEIAVKEVLDTASVQRKMRKSQDRMAALQSKAEAAQADPKKASARFPEVKTLVETMLAEYKAGSLGSKLQKSKTGLEYVIIAPGEGESLERGEPALTHYYGCLKADGNMFDNSFERGAPASFTVGQLVPGFNEGMMLLKPGGKALLFLPANLGYGSRVMADGKIPPNSDLVFYVEVE